MKIKVILNGGLKSCCQTYPSEMIRTALRGWFKDDEDIETEVVDKMESDIQLDQLGSLAYQFFGENIYPIVYVNDVLAAIGNLPDSNMLHKMVQNPDRIAISEQDILEAAKKHGVAAKT
ncbi:MAG: hypothetical protein ONB37_19250 [candidate division KSB1 bacterium]|nr:hypothetical protein [candidate division KSB1 bacterium]